MTYPPQQPGPYDPQGGGYPQSGGYPQQPGGYPANPQSGGFQQPGAGGFQQPGTGGFQQPGGYPPAGGMDPQQPGAYPPGTGGFQQPYQTGGFQQPGMGGFQPGYPGGMGPRKNSALPWILTGGGVLVVGVVILLLFVFGVFGGGSGGANTGDPKSVAQAYVTALNNNDSATMKSLACSVQTPTNVNVPTGEVPTSIPQAKFNLQLEGDPTVSGSTATGKAKGTVNGSSVEYQYQLDNNNGSWCVDLTKLQPVLGNGGQSVGTSGDNSSGSNDSGSNSSGSNSSSSNGGGNSSSTNINFDELSVGSCMSGDPNATDLSGYANADCSSSEATMKILAIYPDSTKTEFDSDTLDPCNDVSQTDFPMWHGDGSGITGTIYCVGKTS